MANEREDEYIQFSNKPQQIVKINLNDDYTGEMQCKVCGSLIAKRDHDVSILLNLCGAYMDADYTD